MMVSPAIKVRQLGKRVGTTTLLAPLDLSVPQGAILALIGHNGAGKSTLIKMLLNITTPTQGGRNGAWDALCQAARRCIHTHWVRVGSAGDA